MFFHPISLGYEIMLRVWVWDLGWPRVRPFQQAKQNETFVELHGNYDGGKKNVEKKK